MEPETGTDLFDLLSPDYEEANAEVVRWLATIAADREALGTIADDPITDGDIWFAERITLISRFARGKEISAHQRKALVGILHLGVTKTLEGLAAKHERREASRRGGKAGRTADPAEVMLVWRMKLALCNGKKTAADRETADELNLSERTVRAIRSPLTATK